MARDPDLEIGPIPNANPAGKPDQVPADVEGASPEEEIDRKYWETCLSDAERAEGDWRSRGRDIIKIYRNEGHYTGNNKKKLSANQTFNILYSNTEVMQAAIYAKPPTPIVRSRFVKKSEPPVPIMPPTPPAPPGMMGAPPPGGIPGGDPAMMGQPAPMPTDNSVG